jgi:hypothetical protein
MARTNSKSSRDKVRAHRKRLRQEGLRPIRICSDHQRTRGVDVASATCEASQHRKSVRSQVFKAS